MKRIGLKDIAEETGLSVAAVSLVLNNKPNKISQASRELILETAKRLDYRGKAMLAAQKRPKTMRLGLIVPDTTSFFADLMSAANDCALSHGYSVLISCSNNLPGNDRKSIQGLRETGVDGLLIAPSTQTTAEGYALLASQDIPVILVDRVIPQIKCTSLTYNHRKGAYLATKHLLELGHRNIACLTGDETSSASVAERVGGFLWAYEEAGLEPAENCFFPGNYKQSESGYLAADSIFAGGFTALFSCNDMMAIGVYKRAAELGRKIPRDLSIIGFDDIQFAELLNPPLTTVRQDALDLGREAVEHILEEINNPEAPHRAIFYEPALIQRESVIPHS